MLSVCLNELFDMFEVLAAGSTSGQPVPLNKVMNTGVLIAHFLSFSQVDLLCSRMNTGVPDCSY